MLLNSTTPSSTGMLEHTYMHIHTLTHTNTCLPTIAYTDIVQMPMLTHDEMQLQVRMISAFKKYDTMSVYKLMHI